MAQGLLERFDPVARVDFAVYLAREDIKKRLIADGAMSLILELYPSARIGTPAVSRQGDSVLGKPAHKFKDAEWIGLGLIRSRGDGATSQTTQ